MKENKLDNLFKDGLRDMEKSPRPIAWDKISEGIKKEKSTPKIIWWQKAAIIVILCLSGFLLFYKMDGFKSSQSVTVVSKVEHDDKEKSSKEVNKTLLNDDSSSNPSGLADSNLETPKEENLDPIKSKGTQNLAESDNKKAEKPEVNMYALENTFPYSDREDDQEALDYEEAVAANTSDDIGTEKPEKSTPSVTIEFRSGKKSRQKTLVADNKDIESNEDQSFTLKKLIAKVKEVKEGELGLAELRQAKDDLFAFDTFKEINKPTEK